MWEGNCEAALVAPWAGEATSFSRPMTPPATLLVIAKCKSESDYESHPPAQLPVSFCVFLFQILFYQQLGEWHLEIAAAAINTTEKNAPTRIGELPGKLLLTDPVSKMSPSSRRRY
jgi:hypothetical protein